MSAADDFLRQAGAAPAQAPQTMAQKFLSQSGAPMQQTPSVQSDGSLLSNIKDAANAAGHHFGNFFHGSSQLIENALGAGVHAIAPGTKADTYINGLVKNDNEYMRQREAQYQASVPNSPGAYAGAAVGEVAPMFIGGAAKALGSAGDMGAAAISKLSPLWEGLASKTAQNVGRGIAQGAVISATAPVTNDGDYWGQKAKQEAYGAALGGALPIATTGVVGAAKQLKGALAPWLAPNSIVAPFIEKVSGSDPQKLADTLSNYQTFVPGSVPTTAQVLQTPAAVMAEKTFANTGPGKVAMTERQVANNAARLDYLQKFAGTPADLEQAIAVRKTEAAPFIDQLNAAQPIDASPIIDHLDKLASGSLGTDHVIRGAISDARNIITAQGVPGEGGSLNVSPDILDGIRQNIRGYLQKYASNGAVSTRQEAALGPLKNTIVNTIDAGVPGYRDYLAAYAKNSIPVNTMEQLQKFSSALDTRASDSAGNSSFTLTNAQKLAAQLDRANNPISPEASRAVDNILADLQRESVSNSVRAGSGSDTALNLQTPGWLSSQLYGNSFAGKPGNMARGIGAGLGWLLGQTVDQGLAGAGAGTLGAAKISSAGSERVNEALARAMMDPAQAAQLAQARVGNSGSYSKLLADALSKAPVLGAYFK